MQIMINYDLLETLKNSNEKFGLKKITRAYKIYWLKYHIPIFTLFDMAFSHGDVVQTIKSLPLQLSCTYFVELLVYLSSQNDRFKTVSDARLIKLLVDLANNDVDTSYELLKQSTMYDKNYELKRDNKNHPELVQTKYFYVPVYDYSGNINDLSIQQEHVMGSKTYVLSLGSPKKVLKPAFSSI